MAKIQEKISIFKKLGSFLSLIAPLIPLFVVLEACRQAGGSKPYNEGEKDVVFQTATLNQAYDLVLQDLTPGENSNRSYVLWASATSASGSERRLEVKFGGIVDGVPKIYDSFVDISALNSSRPAAYVTITKKDGSRLQYDLSALEKLPEFAARWQLKRDGGFPLALVESGDSDLAGKVLFVLPDSPNAPYEKVTQNSKAICQQNLEVCYQDLTRQFACEGDEAGCEPAGLASLDHEDVDVFLVAIAGVAHLGGRTYQKEGSEAIKLKFGFRADEINDLEKNSAFCATIPTYLPFNPYDGSKNKSCQIKTLAPDGSDIHEHYAYCEIEVAFVKPKYFGDFHCDIKVLHGPENGGSETVRVLEKRMTL